MRKRAFPPLEERFEFLGDGMPAGDRSALSSSIFEVEERRTGTPFNLKLWRKTGTAVDDDLRALCSCWTSSFSSRLFCRPQPRSLPACRRMQAPPASVVDPRLDALCLRYRDVRDQSSSVWKRAKAITANERDYDVCLCAGFRPPG
jgi:hypothetical protein